jgi:S1-C subfamily serine protease
MPQPAGLREGDVILQLANAEVSDLKSFEAAWAKADKSKPVNVLVRRGDWAQYADSPCQITVAKAAWACCHFVI